MKNKFCKCYSTQVTQALDTGKEIDEIEVPLKLSILKHLHANWLLEMFNHMTEEDARKVCMKDLEVTAIKEAVQGAIQKVGTL